MSDQRLLSNPVAMPSERRHHRVGPHWTSFFAHLDETVVWLVDAAGMVTYASPSVRRWLGHEPAEIVGKPLELLCHPDEALAFVVALGRCTAATPGSAVQRLRTADGGWRKLELTLVSLRRDALAGGMLIAGRDAT